MQHASHISLRPSPSGLPHTSHGVSLNGPARDRSMVLSRLGWQGAKCSMWWVMVVPHCRNTPSRLQQCAGPPP